MIANVSGDIRKRIFQIDKFQSPIILSITRESNILRNILTDGTGENTGSYIAVGQG
jgi:hypothetical protein